MAVQNTLTYIPPQDLKKTAGLIRDYNLKYNSNRWFRFLFDFYLKNPYLPAYRGKSLRSYLKIISAFTTSPNLKYQAQLKYNPENVKDLFSKYYGNGRGSEFLRLQQATSLTQPQATTTPLPATPSSRAEEVVLIQAPLEVEPRPTQPSPKEPPKISLSNLPQLRQNLVTVFRQRLIPSLGRVVSSPQIKVFLNGTGAIAKQFLVGAARMSLGAGRVGLAVGSRAAVMAAGGAVAASPVGWAVAIALIIIAVILGIFFLGVNFNLFPNTALLPPYQQNIGEGESVTPPLVPQKLVLRLEGRPERVPNREATSIIEETDISYSATITYTGTGKANILVFDDLQKIQNEMEFVGASQGGALSGRKIVWNINDLLSNTPTTLSFTLRPAISTRDTNLPNFIEAQILSIITPTPAPTPEGQISPPVSTDFESLMRTQGRNINILGDINNFVAAVKRNSPGNFPTLLNHEGRLQMIYTTASTQRVNPLAVLTIWGVEQTFRDPSTGAYFGCAGSNFEQQLRCAINVLDREMNTFYRVKGSNSTAAMPIVGVDNKPTGGYCYYDEEFIYSYEMYTPVCHYPPHHAANANSRRNFVNIYTTLLK